MVANSPSRYLKVPTQPIIAALSVVNQYRAHQGEDRNGIFYQNLRLFTPETSILVFLIICITVDFTPIPA